MTLSEIHARLLEIQAGIRYNGQGICANLHYHHSNYLVDSLADGWVGRCSELYYPVDGADEFFRTCNLWDNPRRHALLQHCINRTKSVEVFPVEDFRNSLNYAYVGYECENEDIIRQLLERYS